MFAGDWVLYYPNDLDADDYRQVLILYWVDARHSAMVRFPGGREEEVATYKLATSFATL